MKKVLRFALTRFLPAATLLAVIVGMLLAPAVRAPVPVQAAPLELWAKSGSFTLPDGTSTTIWGFASSAGGAPTLPGPTIFATEGDEITITLHNDLAENVAIVFPGQNLVPDYTGAAPGGTATYTFTVSHPGSFLYESGTNISVQVPMGLYGAIIVRPAGHANWAYDSSSTAFDTEAVMVLSEIDPALNANPAAFNPYNWNPEFFLMNGKAYPNTDAIVAGSGGRVLFRYLNAGAVNHSIQLLGLYQTVVGYDGYLLNYSYQTFSQLVGAGQTFDLISTIPAGALTKYPLYVRSTTMDAKRADVIAGGMMTFITPPITDIAVTSVSAPASLGQGTVASVSVTVRNTGNQAVGDAFNVSLADTTGGTAIGTPQAVAGLAVGDTATLTFNWDTTSAAPGVHTLTGSHDKADSNLANNSATTTTTIQAPVVDIAITGVSAPASVTESLPASVNVTLQNIGNMTTTNINVSLNDTTAGAAIGAPQLIASMAPGASTTLTFNWNTTGAAAGNHVLTASHDKADSNLANNSNTATTTIVAQVNDIALAAPSVPATVVRGATVNVGVTVQNIGNMPVADNITVSLSDTTAGTTIGTPQIVNGLAAGASATLTFSWDTTGLATGSHTLTASHNKADDNAANNTSSATVTVEAPNTDIGVVLTAPATAVTGATVSVSANVTNNGNMPVSGDITVSLSDTTAGTAIGTPQVVAGLAPGASATLTFNWNTTGATIGNHTLTASHNITDDNPANNSSSATVAVAAPITDVAITAISANPNTGTKNQPGTTITISVTVQNTGNQPVSNVTVTLRNTTKGNTIGTQVITSLAAGESVTLTFTWSTAGQDARVHTLTASQTVTGDSNATNNSMATTVTVTEN